MKRHHLFSLLIISSLNTSHAATLLEMYNTGEGVTRIWIDDHYAHFIPNQDQKTEETMTGEMLLDLKNGKAYSVNHDAKVALELPVNENHSHPTLATPKVKVAIEKHGSGPAVAGFATERYSFKANGILCSDVFFSKKLLDNKHVKTFFQTLFRTSSSSDAGNKQGICEIAGDQSDIMRSDKSLAKYGIAMRSTDKSGKLEFEIRAVKDNVTPPANFMGIPAGYKIMTMRQMMQQIQKNAGMN